MFLQRQTIVRRSVSLIRQNKSTTTIIENCKHVEDAQTVAGDEDALKFNTLTLF